MVVKVLVMELDWVCSGVTEVTVVASVVVVGLLEYVVDSLEGKYDVDGSAVIVVDKVEDDNVVVVLLVVSGVDVDNVGGSWGSSWNCC